MRIRPLLCLPLFLPALMRAGDDNAARVVPVVTIPHVAAGGDWKTCLRILNVSKTTQEVRVEVYDAQGQSASVLFNGQPATWRGYLIPPLGVQDVNLTRDSGLLSGYAHLVFLGGAALPHTLLFTSSNGVQGALGKNNTGNYISGYIQFDNTEQNATGAAFLVPAATSSTLQRLTCYASNGAPLGSYTFPVPGGSDKPPGGYRKISLVLPNELSSTEGLSGTCHISYSLTGGASEYSVTRPAISLRFSHQSFLPLSN